MNNQLRNFTPIISEMDLEWIEEKRIDNFVLKSFRITSSFQNNRAVRTYGLVGFPDMTKPHPAILHIHGGGQTCSEENILYQLKRGYVCMSFDWTGYHPDRDLNKVTQYPVSTEKDNPLEVIEYDKIDNEKRYCALKAARCCLALLGSFKQVDKENMGIYGISWGGFLTWIVNGTDLAAKCALPVYGSGGLHWPDHLWNLEWSKMSLNTQKEWMNIMEPRSYASTQSGPVLYLNGTNDFFGGFDVMGDFFPMINSRVFCDFTPNTNHHLDSGSVKMSEIWFDHFLKKEKKLPSPPPLKVEFIDENTLRVITKKSSHKLVLFYSHGDMPHEYRCWFGTSSWEESENRLETIIHVTGETWLYIRKYSLQEGYTISSHPLCLSVPQIPVKKSELLFDGKSMMGNWGRFCGGTELMDAGYFEKETLIDHNGLSFKSNDEIITTIIFNTVTAPQFRPDRSTKSIIIEISNMQELILEFRPLSYNQRENPYIYSIKEPENGIHEIFHGYFKDKNGNELNDFSKTSILYTTVKTFKNRKAQIHRICWS